MVDYMLALHELLKVDLLRPLRPPETNPIGMTKTCSNLFHTSFLQQLNDILTIIPLVDTISCRFPLMLAAPRFAHTIKPGVKRAIVILNAMVTGGDKFV